MKITDLYDNPRLLADFLGIAYEPTTFSRRYYQSRVTEEVTISADDVVAKQLDLHRHGLREDWQRSKENPHKRLSHTQFVAECLRDLGIRTGPVKERIRLAVERFPEVYSPAGAA